MTATTDDTRADDADDCDPLDSPLFAVPTAAEVAEMFATLGEPDPFL